MLPDYSKAKRQIIEILEKELSHRADYYLGPMAMKKNRIFEGMQIVTVMENGKQHNTEVQKLSGEVQTLTEDILSGNPKVVLDIIDKMARQFADDQQRVLFEALAKVTHETGREINYGGRPLDAEMIFSAIENMEVNFDANGKMEKLTFAFPPALEERAKEILIQMENSAELKTKYDNLVERKREQWRDREASRKLVG